MNAPIPLDDALNIIRETIRPIGGDETVLVGQALGRCLAVGVVAPRALPPFDNTAVDGYAFRHADVGGEGTARLPLQGESAAGVPFSGVLPAGAAIRISTGAVLPEGADTVAMQEDTRIEDGAVTIDPVPTKAANVRFAGGDIGVGETALPAGHRLRPQDVALLHALGVAAVSVKPGSRSPSPRPARSCVRPARSWRRGRSSRPMRRCWPSRWRISPLM
jgi:molybdopterin molybdotransferase